MGRDYNGLEITSLSMIDGGFSSSLRFDIDNLSAVPACPPLLPIKMIRFQGGVLLALIFSRLY